MMYLNDTEIHIRQGEMVFDTVSRNVHTVLGSCIAITMLHRPTGTYAMCHAMLPESASAPRSTQFNPFNYVDSVAEIMVARFREAGISVHELEIKYFGGADMFEGSSQSQNTVGKKNIRMVHSVLHAYHVHAAASDVGGVRGRKIVFDTTTGDVFVRKLRENDCVA